MSFLTLSCDFLTVLSSSISPIIIITAISAAAKYSPIATDAMSAILTSTFAFKSNSVINPFQASRRKGVPLITILIKAGSKGKIPFSNSIQLIKRNNPEIAVKIIVRYSLSFLNLLKSIIFSIFTTDMPKII